MKINLYYNCIICNKRYARIQNKSEYIFDGFGVCGTCFEKLHIINTDGGFDGTKNLDYVIAATNYNDKIIKDGIQKYKFLRIRGYEKLFSDLIIRHINQCGGIEGVDFIMSVPLSKTRFNFRGFNQAELVARTIASYYDICYSVDKLIRNRDTKKQSRLFGAERVLNVAGAFSVIRADEVRGKSIMLVDDVYTTGNTMESCAKTLKEAGAKRVVGLTVAIVRRT